MTAHQEATFYALVEPEWTDTELTGAKVLRVVQRAPSYHAGLYVKITLRVPEAALLPVYPEVVVTVPEPAGAATAVQAIAEVPC